MQCRLQIDHTGLDVVHNSGDQLCKPGREVVPGLSLWGTLPAQGAMMVLSSVWAHPGGGQKGSQLSKQGHDYEPRSGAVWREDLFAIPCQTLLTSHRSRQRWCYLRRLQWQACVYQSSELACGGVSLAKSRLMDWQEPVQIGLECLEHKFFKALWKFAQKWDWPVVGSHLSVSTFFVDRGHGGRLPVRR